jgi:ribosomal protein L37AE/L43A
MPYLRKVTYEKQSCELPVLHTNELLEGTIWKCDQCGKRWIRELVITPVTASGVNYIWKRYYWLFPR